MSTPEQAASSSRERLFTFDDVSSDVLTIGIGDTVEVAAFTTQFDPLVVSLVNANLAGDPEGSRVLPSKDFYLKPDSPRPLGTFAVQQTQGLSPRGRLLFAGWPSTIRLPSEGLLPRGQCGNVSGASVTLLDKPADADPSVRSIDLLLQGNVRLQGRLARPVITRLFAQKGSANKLRTNFTALRQGAAAHAVAAALRHREDELGLGKSA